MTELEIQSQINEWRRKGWSIPDINGGKQNYFVLIKGLVELLGNDKITNLDEIPQIPDISNLSAWRSYATFLKRTGLAVNQAGVLCLSPVGIEFLNNPTKRHLANLIQNSVRLYGEILELLETSPITLEEVDTLIRDKYHLNWTKLNNTRRRMDWLEVLGLIQMIGNRKWEITAEGRNALKEWILVSPEAIDKIDSNIVDFEIAEPPSEIAMLLQRLNDSPELHKKRSTYNIWAPSPNCIENLHIITQFASERIDRNDLFDLVKKQFDLKNSSVESMMPFLRVSGLIEEVGRNVYLATPAAKAWLETGDDLDFIRLIHSNIQFVGEMIREAENNIVRNDLYEKAKMYGMNVAKCRWIASFLLEAGLLEEPQYLHLKATPLGMAFISELPLANTTILETVESKISDCEQNSSVPPIEKIDEIINRLHNASRDPAAEGKASGVAFEEAIAEIFSFMGFNARRIGGAGNTDVVVHWKDKDGKTIVAILDGKSKSGGQVSHTDISDVAIDTHKDKHNADYIAIVAPNFSGDTIRNHAKKKGFALITDTELGDIARSAKKYGLGLDEIALLFHVPNGLSKLEELIALKQRELDLVSIVISEFYKEEESFNGLSPRDLLLLLRKTEISPSLDELTSVFDLLARPEIGVLRSINKAHSSETVMYSLSDTTRVANHLRALAAAIDKGASVSTLP